MHFGRHKSPENTSGGCKCRLVPFLQKCIAKLRLLIFGCTGPQWQIQKGRGRPPPLLLPTWCILKQVKKFTRKCSIFCIKFSKIFCGGSTSAPSPDSAPYPSASYSKFLDPRLLTRCTPAYLRLCASTTTSKNRLGKWKRSN